MVSNGEEAVSAATRLSYDVVLMDVLMPGVDGLEATRRIRGRLPASRQPHIIAMTANVLVGDRERCLEAGMDDYIGKPIKIEELARALRRHPPVSGGLAVDADSIGAEAASAAVPRPAGLADPIERLLERLRARRDSYAAGSSAPAAPADGAPRS